MTQAIPTDGPGLALRPRTRRRERGVALILVLAALTILTVMLTDFQDQTSSELGSALSARDSLKAEYAARSAIALSRLLIASEPTIRKGLAPLFMLMGGAPPQIPVWQFADKVLGAFNDKAGLERFAALASVSMDKGKKLGIEGAGFDIEILDEDSKINLNAAWRDPLTQTRLAAEILGLIGPPQFESLFTSADGDGQYSDRQAVCGALIDWVDSNQDATTCDLRPSGPSLGPEDSFYQMLEPPYFRKNAPFDSLEELHMVRGVTDDFWTNFIEPDPRNPARRNVTVWGQGKINVNTANPQTLLAIICGGTSPPAKVCTDPMEAVKFLSLVNMIRSFTMGAPIFNTPNGFIATLKQQSPIGMFLQKIGLEPIKFASENEAKKAIATESNVFSLVATGYVKSGQRETKVRVHAVVDFRGAPSPAQLLANQLPPGAAGALGLPGAATAGGAPPTGAALGLGTPGATGVGIDQTSAGALNASPFAGFTAGQLPTGLPAGATLDGDLAFLMPSPGGRIVYFRID
jgi:general secretion pathway protein K